MRETECFLIRTFTIIVSPAHSHSGCPNLIGSLHSVQGRMLNSQLSDLHSGCQFHLIWLQFDMLCFENNEDHGDCSYWAVSQWLCFLRNDQIPWQHIHRAEWIEIDVMAHRKILLPCTIGFFFTIQVHRRGRNKTNCGRKRMQMKEIEERIWEGLV